MSSDSNARRRISCALLVLALGLGLGCQNGMAPFRATSTPDSMERVPSERIRTSMWVLAAEVGELERLLDAPRGDERIMAEDVRDVLTRMRVAARALDTAGRSTQHPVLNEQLDRFVLQIDRAIRAVDREPPNFFRASTVAGSCFLCHGSGGNEFTRGTPDGSGGNEFTRSAPDFSRGNGLTQRTRGFSGPLAARQASGRAVSPSPMTPSPPPEGGS